MRCKITMCKYMDICPAYDEHRERCNMEIPYLSPLLTPMENKGNENCIPLLLEAYHDVKGTDHGEIRKYLN